MAVRYDFLAVAAQEPGARIAARDDMNLTGFEQIELPMLARGLGVCFRKDPPRGYRDGKDRIREMVMRFYDCDADPAARLVNHLEEGGYIGMVDARGRRLRRSRRRKHSDVAANTTARWRFTPTASPPS